MVLSFVQYALFMCWTRIIRNTKNEFQISEFYFITYHTHFCFRVSNVKD